MRVRLKICKLFILLSFLTVCQLEAQHPAEKTISELDAYFREKYGPDQSLVKGVRYYNEHLKYEGHKFFGEDRFTKGSLDLENREFTNVYLKYNLYEQQIILKYSYSDKVYNEIIISNTLIREFELDGRVFRKCKLTDTDTLFFQVLEAAGMTCYYHWTKTFSNTITDRYSLGEFSSQERKSYLLWQSTLHPFKGARSFSRIFPEYRSEILKYIRKKNINVRKATDADMINLMKQCNIIIRS